MTADLTNDERWLRLQSGEFICPCCDLRHTGIMDLSCHKPDCWSGTDEKQPNGEIRTAQDVLTEDFCVIEGEYFLVRCVLELPIIGATDQKFGYGIWVSLSRHNFNVYVDAFDGDGQSQLGPWFGWISNKLNGYPETIDLKTLVQPRDGRQRPTLELEPTDHPLAIEQREGIPFDRLLDIYALNDHDLRVALSTPLD